MAFSFTELCSHHQNQFRTFSVTQEEHLGPFAVPCPFLPLAPEDHESPDTNKYLLMASWSSALISIPSPPFSFLPGKDPLFLESCWFDLATVHKGALISKPCLCRTCSWMRMPAASVVPSFASAGVAGGWGLITVCFCISPPRSRVRQFTFFSRLSGQKRQTHLTLAVQ